MSSMAQAMVEPMVMASRPASLQAWLAATMASRSPMPQAAPNAQMFSYSGPRPRPDALSRSRAQPTGQPAQAVLLPPDDERRDSPLMASASSN